MNTLPDQARIWLLNYICGVLRLVLSGSVMFGACVSLEVRFFQTGSTRLAIPVGSYSIFVVGYLSLGLGSYSHRDG